MFFEVEMRRLVVVEPHELGGHLHSQRAMLRRLLQDIESVGASEEHGYFVAVTTLEDVSEGKVRSGTGSVVFSVNFKCIVFRLVESEVVEAEVTEVMATGIFATCGPASIFVPKKEMEGFEFRLGPSSEYNSWTDSSGSAIRLQALVRLRVLGTRWEPENRTFKAAGTLNGDMLGHVYEEGTNPGVEPFMEIHPCCKSVFCGFLCSPHILVVLPVSSGMGSCLKLVENHYLVASDFVNIASVVPVSTGVHNAKDK